MSPDHRKSDKDRLEDIRAALDKVDSYVAQGREEFERNELLQRWMVFQLLVVGEAASGLSRELRDGWQDVPRRGIIDMRNSMIHGYSYIDRDIVWGVVSADVTVLLSQITAILQELE